MKRAAIYLLPIALTLEMTSTAWAVDTTIGHPWARATPAGAKVGAGYVTLKNAGSAGDSLVSATADVAGRVEIHEMAVVDGVMTMRPIKALAIPAGKSIELKPDSFHIMLMELKQPLKVGETIKGSLTFEKAGTIPVEYAVEAMGGGAKSMKRM